MDNFDQVNALHTVLAAADRPISKSKIQELLACSATAVDEIIADMRLYLNAPIKFERETSCYFYDIADNSKYELPGIWFNSSELYGLFASYQLLSKIGPGLLESHIAPIKDKLESLMHKNSVDEDVLGKRIRILKMAARRPSPKHFSLVATALLMGKQLNIKYAGRDKNKIIERVLSPQRLVHYRDNWYIDAWCHKREQLRTFAVDRIEYSYLINEKSLGIEEAILNAHYSAAYGIFSGEPNKIAVLKFSASVAKWVAEEQWHPEQNGQFDIDGCYQLEIPYRDPRELIQDILKFGADVEVLKPEKLRKDIKDKLVEAIDIYK